MNRNPDRGRSSLSESTLFGIGIGVGVADPNPDGPGFTFSSGHCTARVLYIGLAAPIR